MTSSKNNNVSNTPYFSIGITAYNRKKYIKRCIMSCLDQNFSDFEVVVVDDGSTDNTVEVIKGLKDSRLRLVQHSTNRGLSTARYTAVSHSNGKWLISFDSDWEMLPGALNGLHERTLTAPEDVGVIGSSFKFDDGSITPAFVPDSIVDYEGRIKWTEAEGGTDYCRCMRREIYTRVNWPQGRRGALDSLFALNLAKVTKQRIDRDFIALQFLSSDSSTRGEGLSGIKALLKEADDYVWMFDEILRVHGEVIAGLAPRLLNKYRYNAAKYSFLSGNCRNGIHLSLQCLKENPTSQRVWSILLFGIISKKLLAFANIYSRSVLSSKRTKPKKVGHTHG